MDLHVVTSALRNYSSDLHSWSGDTSAATSYVSSHLNLTWSDGMMFQPVIQVNDNVVPAIQDALARIKTVLEASGLELRAAAKMYDETDKEVAGHLDQKYEAIGPPAQRYSDIASPATDTVPEPPEGEPTSPTPSPSSGGGGGGGGGGSW
ncbi:MAG: secretion-associated protein [Nocardioides sp.]|nr:secretion-associated protein [Nocardioides sp.]